jgi:hypothetical protein
MPVPNAPERPRLPLFAIMDVQTAGIPAHDSPLVTQPLAPKVDGKDLFTETTASATAKISWNAPQTGHATQYLVTLLHWENLELAKISFLTEGFSIAAMLVVPGDVNEINVPAGVMQEGEEYVAVIEAMHAGDLDFKVGDAKPAPYRAAQPWGRAGLISSSFRVTN